MILPITTHRAETRTQIWTKRDLLFTYLFTNSFIYGLFNNSVSNSDYTGMN